MTVRTRAVALAAATVLLAAWLAGCGRGAELRQPSPPAGSATGQPGVPGGRPDPATGHPTSAAGGPAIDPATVLAVERAVTQAEQFLDGAESATRD